MLSLFFGCYFCASVACSFHEFSNVLDSLCFSGLSVFLGSERTRSAFMHSQKTCYIVPFRDISSHVACNSRLAQWVPWLVVWFLVHAHKSSASALDSRRYGHTNRSLERFLFVVLLIMLSWSINAEERCICPMLGPYAEVEFDNSNSKVESQANTCLTILVLVEGAHPCGRRTWSEYMLHIYVNNSG